MSTEGKVFFIDRATGEKVEEKIPGASSLNFLYGSPLGKASLGLLIKRKVFSQMGGGYMNSRRSSKKIADFVKNYGIDLGEYIVPDEGYSCFNDFFYRKRKDGFIQVQEGLVSPADGKILVFQDMDEVRQFFVKGSAFTVGSFLQDDELAKKYEGGSMAIIRLAPADYHRFHFPASGHVSETTHIRGPYYSVSPLALRKSLEIFCENKREHCTLASPVYGDINICDVGATLTGSIIQTHTPNSQVEAGDEKGYFAFGGSTVVLLLEKGKVQFADDLLQNTRNGFETTIKTGESIGIGRTDSQ